MIFRLKDICLFGVAVVALMLTAGDYDLQDFENLDFGVDAKPPTEVASADVEQPADKKVYESLIVDLPPVDHKWHLVILSDNESSGSSIERVFNSNFRLNHIANQVNLWKYTAQDKHYQEVFRPAVGPELPMLLLEDNAGNIKLKVSGDSLIRMTSGPEGASELADHFADQLHQHSMSLGDRFSDASDMYEGIFRRRGTQCLPRRRDVVRRPFQPDVTPDPVIPEPKVSPVEVTPVSITDTYAPTAYDVQPEPEDDGIGLLGILVICGAAVAGVVTRKKAGYE